jgi:hypothetical protein
LKINVIILNYKMKQMWVFCGRVLRVQIDWKLIPYSTENGVINEKKCHKKYVERWVMDSLNFMETVSRLEENQWTIENARWMKKYEQEKLCWAVNSPKILSCLQGNDTKKKNWRQCQDFIKSWREGY